MSPPGGTARSAKGAVISAFRLALSLVLAALAAQAHAAGAPIVRTRIAPASVTIGQPVTLTIDVLVPTWFGGGIEYPPALAVPDAVATLSDERAVNLGERIGGESYAGMTKTYVIVPRRPARSRCRRWRCACRTQSTARPWWPTSRRRRSASRPGFRRGLRISAISSPRLPIA